MSLAGLPRRYPSRRPAKTTVAQSAGATGAAGVTGEAQKAHLRASRGISLRHSGQGTVSASLSGWVWRRAISAFIGCTTKKKTAAAIETNASQRVEEAAVFEDAAVDREGEPAEVRLADDGGDDRGDEVGDEGRDDGAERRAYDDADRQVHDVPPQEEALEVLDHGDLPVLARDGAISGDRIEGPADTVALMFALHTPRIEHPRDA